MKRYVLLVAGLIVLAMCVSCTTAKKGYRADDPYLYKRGPWNLSKGGIVDDIPQFLWQMTESMLDFGKQPIDPPSPYEADVNPTDYSSAESAPVVRDGRPEASSDWSSQY